MKSLIFIILILSSVLIYAQDAVAQADSVDWKSVQVYEFKSRNYPHTLAPFAEWFVDGSAKTMAELTAKELESIKIEAAVHGCMVVFVDLKGYFTSPGKNKLYVLGLKRKER